MTLVMNTEQAAKHVGISESMIRRCVCRGEVPVVRFSDQGAYYFTLGDLTELVERRRTKYSTGQGVAVRARKPRELSRPWRDR